MKNLYDYWLISFVLWENPTLLENNYIKKLTIYLWELVILVCEFILNNTVVMFSEEYFISSKNTWKVDDPSYID